MSGNEGAFWMLTEAINSNFQGFGQQPVVGVKKNQVFTATFLYSCVTGRGRTCIFLIDVAHERITPNDRCSAIAGTIIYNEDLRKGKVRLIQVLDNPVESGG